MSSPSVIVFDLGKVLLDFDYGIAAQALARESDCEVLEMQRLIDQSPLLHRFEMGQLTEQEFFTEVQTKTGFRGDLARFRPLFANIFRPIGEMVAVQEQVRQQHPTFILSNTNSLAIGHIRQQFEFFGRFTGYIYSYEHGAMKPDARLYEIVERQAGQRGDQILFIDDRAENVEAAAQRGWRTICHQTPYLTSLAMKKQGLL